MEGTSGRGGVARSVFSRVPAGPGPVAPEAAEATWNRALEKKRSALNNTLLTQDNSHGAELTVQIQQAESKKNQYLVKGSIVFDVLILFKTCCK